MYMCHVCVCLHICKGCMCVVKVVKRARQGDKKI